MDQQILAETKIKMQKALQVLQEDPDIPKVLSREEIQSVVNPQLQLRNVDAIFSRVFAR